jgi:hypothetical protein
LRDSRFERSVAAARSTGLRPLHFSKTAETAAVLVLTSLEPQIF